MWASSTISYISLFWHQQTYAVLLYCFHVPYTVLSTVYFHNPFHITLFLLMMALETLLVKRFSFVFNNGQSVNQTYMQRMKMKSNIP